MKKLLINIFRKCKKYFCKWKSKQKKLDYAGYLFFWIGIIVGICFIEHYQLIVHWYEYLIIVIYSGVFLELFFIIAFFTIAAILKIDIDY